MDFGLILKKCRLRAKLTQEQLAERLFLARSAVSKLENNKQVLDAQTLFAWIRETGTPDVAVALLYGVDATTIVQQVMSIMFTFWLI